MPLASYDVSLINASKISGPVSLRPAVAAAAVVAAVKIWLRALSAAGVHTGTIVAAILLQLPSHLGRNTLPLSLVEVLVRLGFTTPAEAGQTGSDDVRLSEICCSKARGAEENRVTKRKKIFEGHQH